MKELLETDDFTPLGAVNKYRAESERRCAPIDARIVVLEKQYHALTDEYNAIKDLPVPRGFFAAIRARIAVKNLHKRMVLNNELLAILYRKRIANT